jgi:predicted nucleic acid-binding Zn ribbon protein
VDGQPEEVELACPQCGTPSEPDQEYCLECGERLPASRVPPERPRLWIWAALALAIVVAGAIVGLLAAAREGDGGEAATVATPTTGLSASLETDTAADTGLLPGFETVTVPPATDLLPETGIPETLPPPPETQPPPGVISWPAGTSGYTVVLASIPTDRGRAAAESRAQVALAAGLPEVGILDSSSYSSLRPGFWVVFSGVYTDLAQARAAVGRARSAGFPDAYSRRVAA